jgi:hypothetical protein
VSEIIALLPKGARKGTVALVNGGGAGDLLENLGGDVIVVVWSSASVSCWRGAGAASLT